MNRGGGATIFAFSADTARRSPSPRVPSSPPAPATTTRAANARVSFPSSKTAATRLATASTISSWCRKRTSRFVGCTLTSTVSRGKDSATNTNGFSDLGSAAAYASSHARRSGAHSTSRSLMNSTNVVLREWYEGVLTSASTAKRIGSSAEVFRVASPRVAAGDPTFPFEAKAEGFAFVAAASAEPGVQPPAAKASGARRRAVASP